MSPARKSPHVRSLDDTENLFLEVLLDRFKLTRLGRGVRLDVSFDGNTPAVSSRNAVDTVRDHIRHFRRRSAVLQSTLDAFLLDGVGKQLEVAEPGFPFRFASGGSLPVLRLGGNDFYCLFYRDVYPVGWNIANGGSGSRAELRNPLETMERELREELVILDPKNRRRYVFSGEAGRPVDLPEFSAARRIWGERLNLPLSEFLERPTPVKWLHGPDEVCIRSSETAPSRVAGCFLNINALDFGIEIDRVVRIGVDEDAVLLNGELLQDEPLNQIVGLFEVGRLDRDLAAGCRRFIPDRCFWSGRPIAGPSFEKTLQTGYFKQPRLRGMSHAAFRTARHQFDLCPATRSILRRHAGSPGNSMEPRDPSKVNGPFDVFVSYPSEDLRTAAVVHEWCAEKGLKSFLSNSSLYQSNFSAAIDDAIDAARHMVVVATRPEFMLKDWVSYEWTRFHVDIQNRRKPDAQLVSFIAGFDPAELPGPLRIRHATKFSRNRPRLALPRLEPYFRA